MEIICGGCGGDNLTRDSEAPKSTDIPLLCLDCGWRGRRTPGVSCPRCGSRDHDETPIDGWTYADRDEARERPESAEWGYVDKTLYRCHKCRHEWMTAGTYRPHPSGDAGHLIRFVDDDAGYERWLTSWPQGYVLNCNRHPSSEYLILHRASCHFISELQRGMQTFTGDYIKVCSTDRATVRQWAQSQTGAEATYCMHCL